MKLMFFFLCFTVSLNILASPLPPTDAEVIIIGAGWAGMGTADHLARSNFSNFLILEATNRTGGRSESIEFGDPSVGRFIFERGSNWVCGAPGHGGPSQKQQPVYAEMLRIKKISKFDTLLIPGGTQNMSNFWRVYNRNGTRVDKDGSIRKRADAALDCLNRTASHLQKEITNRQGLIQCGWEPETEAELAVDWGFTVDDNGVRAKMQSLKFSLPDPTYAWWGPDDYFVLDQNPRGYAHLLDTMTADTVPPHDSRLVLNTVVTQIDYTSTPIKVTSQDGRIFHTKHVISTLPLGVLKHNHATLFVPPMPEEQEAVLNSDWVIMANLTKIFVQFKEPFWDNRAARWLSNDAEYGAFPEWHNLNHRLHVPGSNTLFIWLGQPQSTKWESASESEVVAAIMKNLRQRYPDKDLVDPIDFHITQHSLNPFRYGAYSLFMNGATEQGINQIKSPLKIGDESRVSFAGEHTCSNLQGFTHGALISGREAASDYLGQKYASMCN